MYVALADSRESCQLLSLLAFPDVPSQTFLR